MQHKPELYKWNYLVKKIKNSRYGEPKIRGKNVTARVTDRFYDGSPSEISIRHHNTDIAVISPIHRNAEVVRIFIDNGGYRTATTKHYLNEILEAYKTGAGIFQKNFVWFFNVKNRNGTAYTKFVPVMLYGVV